MTKAPQSTTEDPFRGLMTRDQLVDHDALFLSVTEIIPSSDAVLSALSSYLRALLDKREDSFGDMDLFDPIERCIMAIPATSLAGLEAKAVIVRGTCLRLLNGGEENFADLALHQLTDSVIALSKAQAKAALSA